LNHHVVTARILSGSASAGTELNSLIRRNHLDPDELIHLISGNDQSMVGQIFSAPINVDTVEAIWRGHFYLQHRAPHPLRVLNAFISLAAADLSVLDSFWAAKDRLYQALIYSSDGLTYDFSAQRHVESSTRRLMPGDFFLNETEFLRKFAATTPFDPTAVPVTSKSRRFAVNHAASVCDHGSLPNRYRTRTKQKTCTVMPRRFARQSRLGAP
jgi:hypothetical protein